MKKKMLVRIGSMRHGGAEKVLATFLKNIPKEHFEIDLLLNLYSGKYLSEIPSWINILYLNKGEMITTNRPQDIPQKIYRKLYQGYYKAFPKVLYSNKLQNKVYDIELIANHALFDEVMQSPLSSKKVVWIHSDIFHEQTDIDQFRKYFQADQIWVISEKIKESFEKLASNDEERNKVIKIYNPIDAEEVIEKSNIDSSKNPFNKDVPNFVAIGTVYPAKGFDRLLHAHKTLLAEGFAHRLMIIGDGYDFENIKKLRDDLDLHKTVELVGFTDNPYPFLKDADAFILSSRYEGFPTVVAEAVLLKKPIIATDVSGVCDILNNGNLGLIVENSDEGIKEGMRRFLTEENLSKDYIAKIQAHQLPFTLEKSVSSLVKNLDRL